MRYKLIGITLELKRNRTLWQVSIRFQFKA
jgi:hypothetical protein